MTSPAPEDPAVQELRVQLEQLRAQHDALQRRVDLWAQNGLGVADTGSIFAGSGGAFGTSTRVKRSDGT